MTSTLVPVTARRVVQTVDRCTPVEALRALLPMRATLLESRSGHPDARFSFVPFNPTVEIRLLREEAIETDLLTGIQRTHGRPWEFLREAFSRWTGPPTSGTPFSGGWVGYLAYEAAAWILDVPTAAPAPPARHGGDFGVFRFYPDVLVLGPNGDPTMVANDVGDGGPAAAERLEAAARLLRHVPPAVPPARALDTMKATLGPRDFEQRVEGLQERIREGDCFQANLTSSFAFPWRTPPTRDGLVALYDAYAAANPGAWAAFFETDDLTILSSSPECLYDARAGRLRLRPIAGTRRRGRDAAEDARLADELRTDPKERSEHAMLVDLARNDAAVVCRPGTVRVPNFAGVERYRHVMHLVSEVDGELRPDVRAHDILSAVFPGGTVTGAPKRRAAQRIVDLEPGPRGPYTGALGYVGMDGDSQFNLLIRTLIATPTHLVAHAGCGIVEGSRADAESEELATKARAQVEAAVGRATPATPSDLCGEVDPGPPWSATSRRGPATDARVLLVDFEDSFVHNLADYCRSLGATTTVHPASAPVPDAWLMPPTHVILSPGPGRPEDFPSWREHVERAEAAGIPVLGVCLGHQALAQRRGATITRHARVVHGRASPIHRTWAAASDPLFSRWRGATAGRYHSLVAVDLPAAAIPLARLPDGTCMAFREAGRPHWGVQFHPESLLTEDGLELLAAFLEVGSDA